VHLQDTEQQSSQRVAQRRPEYRSCPQYRANR
jgi:hypothetical protein